MEGDIGPLQIDQFMSAILEHMEPFKGIRIYNAVVRDHLEKTEQIDAGYGRWIKNLFAYLVHHYNLEEHASILDVGCGTGELVVRMNRLGFQATGIDLHEKHLTFARILARENDLPETIFVLNRSHDLPFEDKSFDIITLFSVLEHLSDDMVNTLLPELSRVCRSVIYVLVPNKLKITDDHTGLHFVPWMPRWLASVYVKSRGGKHEYRISDSGTWDVWHRSYGHVVSLFKAFGFRVDLPPDDVIYPSLEQCPPIL